MIIDFGLCWLIELVTKQCFATLAPKEMITRGSERRQLKKQKALESSEQQQQKKKHT